MGDSMGSLIGLKNLLIFSAVLLTIGSVSAQLAFAVPQCFSNSDGNWNNPSNWIECGGGTPNATTAANIDRSFNIIITGDEETQLLIISEQGTLFIECDASLNLFASNGFVDITTNFTNHGTFTSVPSFFLEGTLFNSGTVSGVVPAEGGVVQISTICTQPIGGTVGSMDTVSLLVAGAQANMSWWSLALVGMVAAGAAITYKLKSKKTEQ